MVVCVKLWAVRASTYRNNITALKLIGFLFAQSLMAKFEWISLNMVTAVPFNKVPLEYLYKDGNWMLSSPISKCIEKFWFVSQWKHSSGTNGKSFSLQCNNSKFDRTALLESRLLRVEYRVTGYSTDRPPSDSPLIELEFSGKTSMLLVF